MKKHLFFDDNNLFSKVNACRKYVEPKLVGKYFDDAASTDFYTGWVFRLDDGRYRLLYFGHSKKYEGHKLFSAISDNGVDFAPEEIFDPGNESGKMFAHEILDIGKSEIPFIYEDKHTENSEHRYVMLRSGVNPHMIKVDDDVYVSADLISWKKLDGAVWGDGAEPLASIFYNEIYGVHTVVERPFWGIRCAGYKETKDFINYTEYRSCMNVDSLDEDLAEIYGMYAFEYDGNYIGVPHIYHGFGSGLHTKYSSGVMDVQLAYSKDGRYWRRSLRKPYISRDDKSLGGEYKMVWVGSVLKTADGINIYAACTEKEHGPAFSNPGTGVMMIFRTRSDGFVSLATDDPSSETVVATREKIWHGGEMQVNIKATRATMAVYSTTSQDQELNILGIASPIEGYSHEDCIPFSGDSTDWIPKYKSGKTVNDLAGNTLVFEVKFDNGEIFSLCGDYTDAFNVEAATYRRHGVLRLK